MKILQDSCCFKTDRLSVAGWTKQTEGAYSEKEFAQKIIQILSPEVTKALPGGWQNITTITAAKKWIVERDTESHFMTITCVNEIVGFIFLYEMEKITECYNLRFGYLLSESVWGQGLGTELIEGLVNWCKQQKNIQSISGGVEKENVGSIKVLEKNNFLISKEESLSENVLFYEYHFNI